MERSEDKVEVNLKDKEQPVRSESSLGGFGRRVHTDSLRQDLRKDEMCIRDSDNVSKGIFPAIGDYFNHHQELLPGCQTGYGSFPCTEISV